MSPRPHFKPPTPGGEPWVPRGVSGVPFATSLSFSSKSPYRYDDWARDVERPYALVAMPSYTPPVMTDALRRDGDFVWYERPIQKPTIVWDGFCKLSLFEIAVEAFRAEPGTMRVRDMINGTWVEDRRQADLLATRPKRDLFLPDPSVDAYGHMRQQRLHRRELIEWADLNKHISLKRDAGAARAAASDWESLVYIYQAYENLDRSWHADTNKRKALSEEMWRKDHTRPLIEDSGYISPVKFMDQESVKRARDGFRPVAQQVEARAKARVRPMPPAVVDAPVPSQQPSLWSRLFGAPNTDA